MFRADSVRLAEEVQDTHRVTAASCEPKHQLLIVVIAARSWFASAASRAAGVCPLPLAELEQPGLCNAIYVNVRLF